MADDTRVFTGESFWYVLPGLTLDGTSVTSLAQVDGLTCTLKAATGSDLDGPITMEAKPGAPGTWRALLKAPAASQKAFITVSALKDDSEGYWEEPIWISDRIG